MPSLTRACCWVTSRLGVVESQVVVSKQTNAKVDAAAAVKDKEPAVTKITAAPVVEPKKSSKPTVKKSKIISLAAVKANSIRITPKEQVLAEKAKVVSSFALIKKCLGLRRY